MLADRAYEVRIEYINQLKEMYSKRIKGLNAYLGDFSVLVKDDESLSILKNSRLTQNLVEERLQEIFKETFVQSSERDFEQLMRDHSYMQALSVEYLSRLESLEQQNEEACFDNTALNKHIEELGEENAGLRQQIASLERGVKESFEYKRPTFQ